MIRRLALTGLLALAVSVPVQEASAQNEVLGGALVGGAAGAIVGGALGGGRGAAIGAVVGAGTGAAIGAQGQPRPGGYYAYQGGCYLQRGDGSYVAVSPRYCGGPPQPRYVEPPPQRVYSDYPPPPPPRCMRSPTYDPRSGTFIARDGYRYPCP